MENLWICNTFKIAQKLLILLSVSVISEKMIF